MDRVATLFGQLAVRRYMSNRRFPRDVLNRLKWEEGASLKDAEIVIVHRGVPGDRMRIPGVDIVSIGHMFFETSESSIPLHRITEIWHRGEKIFDKDERKNQAD